MYYKYVIIYQFRIESAENPLWTLVRWMLILLFLNILATVKGTMEFILVGNVCMCAHLIIYFSTCLTLSWRRPLSYRNQSQINQWTGFYMITAAAMKELSICLCFICTQHKRPVLFDCMKVSSPNPTSTTKQI